MLIMRLFLLLTALLLVVSVGMYLITRDNSYSRFAGRVVRVAALVFALFLLVMLLERYGLMGWRFLA